MWPNVPLHDSPGSIERRRARFAKTLLKRGAEPWPAADVLAKQGFDWLDRATRPTKSDLRLRIARLKRQDVVNLP